MVREVPDYARQYLIEHPEFGPPIHDSCGAGIPTREDNQDPCSADTPVREPKATTAQCKAQAAPSPKRETQAPAAAPEESASQENPTTEPAAIACEDDATVEPAAKRRQNTAHGASRGTKPEHNPAPEERKKPSDPDYESSVENSEEYERIKQAEAAIPGAMAGNWRDLRTVFEFAGISAQNKEAPS